MPPCPGDSRGVLQGAGHKIALHFGDPLRLVWGYNKTGPSQEKKKKTAEQCPDPAEGETGASFCTPAKAGVFQLKLRLLIATAFTEAEETLTANKS